MMRYQLFNDPSNATPVFSAPWRWLAYLVANLFSNKWDRCRLVDSQTGEPLMEWVQASGSLVFGSPSTAAISYLKIGKNGHRHEFLFGQTAYGMGKTPKGGHQPFTVIEVEKEENSALIAEVKTHGGMKIETILAIATGYPDGFNRVQVEAGMEVKVLEELLLSNNIEVCPTCGWYVESHELVPSWQKEPDGHCESCREKVRV